jgi:hypothetical protein
MTDFINALNLAYPNASNCLKTDSNSVFWIDEDDTTKISFIVNQSTELVDEEVMLRVNNQHSKAINILCIDGCIFSSADGSRCDCALFDDDKFCFCELKYDVKNTGTASKNLRKARNEQLSNTILSFKSKVDFALFTKLEAYVVLKKRLYPNRTARLSELKKEFWDKHKVEYFEEKDIIFDAPLKSV